MEKSEFLGLSMFNRNDRFSARVLLDNFALIDAAYGVLTTEIGKFSRFESAIVEIDEGLSAMRVVSSEIMGIADSFTNVLDYKVDKVEGKGLSTNDYDDIAKNKVDNIPASPEYTDTVYTHPANHPPSIITQDANNRFVTDDEKSTWDAKQNALTQGANITISGNTISAVDTVYAHPANHPASMITESTTRRFVTDDEKSTWNGKADNALASASTNGLMSSTDKTKLNGVETGAQKNTITSVQGRTGAVTISKSDVGLGSVNNVAISQAQVTKINELNYTRSMTQEQYDGLSQPEKDRADVWYGIYEE